MFHFLQCYDAVNMTQCVGALIVIFNKVSLNLPNIPTGYLNQTTDIAL